MSMLSKSVQGGTSQPEDSTKLLYFSQAWSRPRVAMRMSSGLALLNYVEGLMLPMIMQSLGKDSSMWTMLALSPKWKARQPVSIMGSTS